MTNETHHDNVDRNVDPREVDKFAKLAARWWDEESEFKPLHRINPLRVDFIDRHSPVAGCAVLDVGCGGGYFVGGVGSARGDVTGIDVGDAPLEVARLHALESGAQVTYRHHSAESLAAEHDAREKWDIVCCLELLEHVPDAASVVAACAALVKRGGAVYFSTINRNPKSFLFAILGAEYILNLLPRGTHQYEKLIRPRELHSWCADAGLVVDEMIGMHYNPLSQSYSLGAGVDVNYMLRCTKT